MNIGAKNYDDSVYQAQLARLDVVVLGFYPGWRGDTNGSVIRSTVQQLKARNPKLKVAQYTILNEAIADPSKTTDDDKIVKLDQAGWWLKLTDGTKTQWTSSYSAYDINGTEWAPADANGDRYPQWLAKRDANRYFKPVPEFDLWYHDNVMKNSRVASANWRLDGVDISSKDPTVAAAFRRSHLANWTAGSAVVPNVLHMGNTDNDLSYAEYKGQLPAAFMEGVMGKSWSIETYAGWGGMMSSYFTTYANLRAPAILGFNVHGSPTDYRFFRYAFSSCLLGNGYFAFTDAAVGFSSVPWFDEYEVALGQPTQAATKTEWSNGVYRRNYENAIVLVNPQVEPRTVTIEPGFRRLLARQDPVTNNGQPATTVTIPSKDGLILVRQ